VAYPEETRVEFQVDEPFPNDAVALYPCPPVAVESNSESSNGLIHFNLRLLERIGEFGINAFGSAHAFIPFREKRKLFLWGVNVDISKRRRLSLLIWRLLSRD